MGSGDILLVRPWIYNKNGIHGMCDNTYMYANGGKQVTLHPKKPKSPKKGSRASTTKEALPSTALCLQKQCQDKPSLRLNSFFNLGGMTWRREEERSQRANLQAIG